MENLPKYALYQSELTFKYFVKYPNSPEKEISLATFNFLKDEKTRMLDNYLKKEVVLKRN